MSVRLIRRTRPWATSRSWSSLIATCQSWVVRPLASGVASARSVPSRTGRRKSVWLEIPKVPPRSASQDDAPWLAAVSASAAYTPPCTSPYGWCRSGVTGHTATTRSPDTSSTRIPSSSSSATSALPLSHRGTPLGFPGPLRRSHRGTPLGFPGPLRRSHRGTPLGPLRPGDPLGVPRTPPAGPLRRSHGAVAQGVGEVALDHGQREVAARPLDDRAGDVGGASQVAGDRLREVQVGEERVDLLHGREQGGRPRQVPAA